MTALVDNTIDEMIRRLKARPNVSDFVFTKGYPSRSVNYPESRYTVAVCNEEVRQSTPFLGEQVSSDRIVRLYDVKLLLRVYAPKNSNGAALLRATSLIADSLEKVDTQRMITAISMSGISYEKSAHTMYRDINVTLDCLVYEVSGDE